MARQVTIFGAGIAGLTVAHELAVRGWKVEVWEKDLDPTTKHECDIGGMARTQWSQVDFPLVGQDPGPGTRIERTDDYVPLHEEISFPSGSAELDKNAEKALHGIAKRLDQVGKKVDVYIDAFTDGQGQPGLAEKRADAVKKYLEGLLPPGLVRFESVPLGNVHERTRDEKEKNYVAFRMRRHVLPGEHGFRFFPAFYWHVFDTMKRIPIFDEVPASPVVEAQRKHFLLGGTPAPGQLRRASFEYPLTHRTVFNNLVTTSSQALELDDRQPPFAVSRRRVKSLEEIRKQVEIALARMGFGSRDIGRLSLKLFQYMTSCPERRHLYENVSWWEFIEADYLSPSSQETMDRWPQALVAMTARDSDARTIGSVFAQILIDQVFATSFTDATLNAPTSVAWFDHWRRFLDRQGVRFIRGELAEIKPTANGFVKPIVKSDDPDAKLPAGIYVVALPLRDAQKLLTKELLDYFDEWNDKLPPDRRNDDSLHRLKEFPIGDVDRPRPDGPLQHMGGIQFYFAEDVQWVDGHTYFPDSEWALTAISQAVFWEHPHDWRDGYRGTLSVCISNWYRQSNTIGKSAWQCSSDEIAHEVWRQIADGFPDNKDRPPYPLFYHLDDNIEFFSANEAVRENLTPLLINRPREWGKRPGRPGAYEVYFKCIAFAGTYMQTHTRLTTMEAANEAGRHAANAVIQFRAPTGREGNLCDIWPLEEREVDDLRFLKDLDAKLFERGLPHLVDILELRRVPDALLPAHGQAREPDAQGLDVFRALTGMDLRDVAGWLGAQSIPLSGLASLVGMLATRRRR